MLKSVGEKTSLPQSNSSPEQDCTSSCNIISKIELGTAFPTIFMCAKRRLYQPAYPHSLIIVFAGHSVVVKDQKRPQGDSEDSNQYLIDKYYVGLFSYLFWLPHSFLWDILPHLSCNLWRRIWELVDAEGVSRQRLRLNISSLESLPARNPLVV